MVELSNCSVINGQIFIEIVTYRPGRRPGDPIRGGLGPASTKADAGIIVEVR